MKRGKFVVVDGLDGVGKGVFLDVFVEEAQKDGKRVFDVDAYEIKYDCLPSPDLIIGSYEVIKTSEPNYSGRGKVIRNDFNKKGSACSAEFMAKEYACCRKELYQHLLIPIREAGIDLYQSRSLSTSVVFQRQQAIDEGRIFSIAEILSIPENKFCADYPMDILVVPIIDDAAKVVPRFENRDKKDDCRYENLDFQLKIKPHFESQEFKELFAVLGVKLVYLDAGVSVEYSQQQAREFYQQNLK